MGAIIVLITGVCCLTFTIGFVEVMARKRHKRYKGGFYA